MPREQYEKVIVAGGRIVGPAAEALLASRMDQDTLDWLTASFFKTGLEPGHCLRTPPKALRVRSLPTLPGFLTTCEDGLRLPDRLQAGQQLIQEPPNAAGPAKPGATPRSPAASVHS